MSFLSVIIPTRNRASCLAGVLESLTRQTCRADLFEVIVIDNGSTDNTRQVTMSFYDRISNLFYHYEPTPGLHAGRHAGLKMAHSDLLVYADDDIEAFPTWLEAIAESFQDPQVALVGGKNLPKFDCTPPAWILKMWKHNRRGNRRLEYLSILDMGDDIKEIDPYCVFGCNFSVKKSIVLEAGGFHPDGMPENMIRYRGDGESHISKHVLKNKYKTLYHPRASVYHQVPLMRMTEAYFCQRAFNQGISDSYTCIRAKGYCPWKSRARHLIRVFRPFFTIDYIKVKIQIAYLKGYYFHQKEVKKDDSLYGWVMNNNYL